jgi:hypothetical protein
VRFNETRFERADGRARLLDNAGAVLLELRDEEIPDAIRTGFIDPANWHYSMFEYAQIRRDVQSPEACSTSLAFDREFLAQYNIRWE